MDDDVLYYSALSQLGDIGPGAGALLTTSGDCKGRKWGRPPHDGLRRGMGFGRAPSLRLEYYSKMQPELANELERRYATGCAISPEHAGCCRGHGLTSRSTRSARSSASGCRAVRRTPSAVERRDEESGSPAAPTVRRAMKVVSCFLKSARVPDQCQTAAVRGAVQRRAGTLRARRRGRRPSAPGRRRPG
jgi:hypothetical protein